MTTTTTKTRTKKKVDVRIADQVKRANRRIMRQTNGRGFRQMVVGSPGQTGYWVFDRTKRCSHCDGTWKLGEVVLVSEYMNVIIHGDCVLAMAEGVSITSTTELELAEERRRIIESGSFYG